MSFVLFFQDCGLCINLAHPTINHILKLFRTLLTRYSINKVIIHIYIEGSGIFLSHNIFSDIIFSI